MADTDFLLNTDQNIQKQYVNVSDSVSVQGTSGSLSGTYTYDHNLGYIPAARVWYEAVSGRWYPLANTQLSNGFTPTTNVMGTYYLTDSQLVVNMQNFGASTVVVNLIVRIYLDK